VGEAGSTEWSADRLPRRIARRAAKEVVANQSSNKRKHFATCFLGRWSTNNFPTRAFTRRYDAPLQTCHSVNPSEPCALKFFAKPMSDLAAASSQRSLISRHRTTNNDFLPSSRRRWQTIRAPFCTHNAGPDGAKNINFFRQPGRVSSLYP